MSATQLATEFASDLGEKLKHESEKLRALELAALPVLKKKQPKKRSKLGLLTLVVTGVGVAYAVFRMVRPSAGPQTQATNAESDQQSNGNAPRPADQRLATAGL